MIERDTELSIRRQCELLGLHRSGLYYTQSVESAENLAIMRRLDEQYLKTPFYGYRKLHVLLLSEGYVVGKKRLKRLMKLMGWETIYRKPNTSKPNELHYKYPYLLRNLEVTRKNQVWEIDITYIPMRRGFMYLCAIIDLKTRYVVHWSVSNTMSSEWCRQTVEEAIALHGKPEIINSDQGSQFTSHVYIEYLKGLETVKISMDGKGRATDNIFIERLWKSVKYEWIYLHVYENGIELYNGLEEYFRFYNEERFHENLGYKTPGMIFKRVA
ncbi:MAG: IS3 family transposase [Ignavibacteria bacterium]|jgi:putative transposase|nr:IS3 family transposase [Ignavibacteria bacterium]MBK9228354.1 IS3 family transposase [Ignavibacteria bacterium]